MSHHDDPFADMGEATRTELARAGVTSLEDAARLTREELLALKGVGPNTLARLVAILEGNEGETGDRDPNEPE
jgi:hypothetical protein